MRKCRISSFYPWVSHKKPINKMALCDTEKKWKPQGLRSNSIPALVAQRIEHLTTDQKVRGSNPFKRTTQVSIEKLSVRFQFGRTK